MFFENLPRINSKRALKRGAVELTRTVPMEHIDRDFPRFTLEELWNLRGTVLVFDIECYPNYFLLAIKCFYTKKVATFEITPYSRCDLVLLDKILRQNCIVGFNSKYYDLIIAAMAVCGWSNYCLKEATSLIIEQNARVSDIEKKYNVAIPSAINHIDLIEVAPLTASLKVYGGRLHSRRMQDLPFHPDETLTQEQMEIVCLYCVNDLDVTELLLEELQEQLGLRDNLSKKYDIDLRSLSDAQMAEAIIGRELAKVLGAYPKRPTIEPGTVFKYVVPDYMSFINPALKEALEIVRNAEFVIQDNGAPKLPPEIGNLRISIGSSVYRMGIGGIHSSEEEAGYSVVDDAGGTGPEIRSEAFIADENYRIIDRDVASYYPRIILNQRLYPKHLGQAFLGVYNDIVERRLRAKRDKNGVEADSLKIVINGSFGKLGSKWSILYAPDLMIQVTISGQLSLLMLVDMLEASGISVISANTDGIVSRIHKDQYELFNQIVAYWESVTHFETEETEYRALFSRDVNNYIAIKMDGSCKGKGVFSNPWEKKKANIFKLHKNPSAIICVEAVMAFLKDGTPIARTIAECQDVTKFVSVKTVKGGGHKNGLYLGKVVRWYYARGEQGFIQYVLNGNKVGKTDGAKPLMDLPTGGLVPDDVDRDWYEAEATDMLYDLGYYRRNKDRRLI